MMSQSTKSLEELEGIANQVIKEDGKVIVSLIHSQQVEDLLEKIAEFRKN